MSKETMTSEVVKKEREVKESQVEIKIPETSEELDNYLESRIENVETAVDSAKAELVCDVKTLPDTEEVRSTVAILEKELGQLESSYVAKMEEAAELPVVLEENHFAAWLNLSDKDKKGINDWLDTLFDKLPDEMRGEMGEWEEETTELQGSIKGWMASYLGLDPSRRMPKPSKIAFLKRRDYKRVTGSPGTGGMHDADTGEIIISDDIGRQALRVFSHEVLHSLSRGAVMGHQVGEGGKDFNYEGTHRSGYRQGRENSFSFFNEGFTELINLEILRYHKEHHGQDLLKTKGQDESGEAIFIDMLIDKAGETTGQGEEFRRNLYKGYFTGDNKPLRELGQVLGKDALRVLVRANPKNHRQIVKLGEKLGLERRLLRKQLWRVRRRKEVTLKNGIVFGNKSA